MNLGKPLKIIVIPERVPAQRPTQTPGRPEPAIPLPADWPVRAPERVPHESGKTAR